MVQKIAIGSRAHGGFPLSHRAIVRYDEIIVFEGLRVFRGRIYKKDRSLAMLWFFAVRAWAKRHRRVFEWRSADAKYLDSCWRGHF